MGVVTLSSSASRTSLGLSASFTTQRNTQKRSVVVSFKGGKSDNIALVNPHGQPYSPIETPKQKRKKKEKNNKLSETVKAKAVSTDEYSSCATEVDYNEAAAKLESIYKLDVTDDPAKLEVIDGTIKGGWRRKKIEDGKENEDETSIGNVVRNQNKKTKRLSLDKRISLRKYREEVVITARKKNGSKTEIERIDELVREYSGFTDSVSLDWKRMKIAPVLSSPEQNWLFKLMQPMKALFQVKDNLSKGLGREATEAELAQATNMTIFQVRKQIEIGRAARNKLIKHNLRLVLFAKNKYFQEFANGPRFQDLCQAGATGLITAIDRFEPNRKFRLSTYGLFWIRHAIIRSITISSLVRVPFSFESIRLQIHRAKLELNFELQRPPADEDIIQRVGISPERYHEVMMASKPVLSLNSRHPETNEELIDGITDGDGVNVDNRQSALLRLALDDVLDSLKPKESLVIRQRYGLDGKGDRTLGEIAGNLSISREMVRKHEVKALMKLQHPARVDYLRPYLV